MNDESFLTPLQPRDIFLSFCSCRHVFDLSLCCVSVRKDLIPFGHVNPASPASLSCPFHVFVSTSFRGLRFASQSFPTQLTPLRGVILHSRIASHNAHLATMEVFLPWLFFMCVATMVLQPHIGRYHMCFHSPRGAPPRLLRNHCNFPSLLWFSFLSQCYRKHSQESVLCVLLGSSLLAFIVTLCIHLWSFRSFAFLRLWTVSVKRSQAFTLQLNLSLRSPAFWCMDC